MVHKIKVSSIRVYRPSYTIAFYDYLFYLNSTLCTRSVCVFMKNEKLIDIITYKDLPLLRSYEYFYNHSKRYLCKNWKKIAQ